jgi:hypothetical protein
VFVLLPADQVQEDIPRVLINKHPVGCSSSSSSGSSSGGATSDGESEDSEASSSSRTGFDFADGSRDLLHLGDCDAAVWQLAEQLGWTAELQQMVEEAAAGAAASAAAHDEE